MGDPSSEILDPDQSFTLASGGTVVVRELNWKESKQFLQRLATRAAEFVKIGPDGKAEVDTKRLMAVIVTDLGEQLVLATTGLPQEEVDALRLPEMVRLLDAAIALNLRPRDDRIGKSHRRAGDGHADEESLTATLGETYDFLIVQGHSRADLDRATWRQIDLFVRMANARLEREAEAIRNASR